MLPLLTTVSHPLEYAGPLLPQLTFKLASGVRSCNLHREWHQMQSPPDAIVDPTKDIIPLNLAIETKPA